MAALKKHPCFITHDWGIDQYGRNNHKRVIQLANNLKERGLPVWIDEHEMTGDIVEQMCNGIENSDIIIVCITQRYLDKVGGDNADDNCKLEFKYGARLAGVKMMIPLVMEERVSNPASWAGPVGMFLGGVLHVKMWEDGDEDGAGLEHLIKEIVERVPGWQGRVKPGKSGNAVAAAPRHSGSAMTAKAAETAQSTIKVGRDAFKQACAGC